MSPEQSLINAAKNTILEFECGKQLPEDVTEAANDLADEAANYLKAKHSAALRPDPGPNYHKDPCPMTNEEYDYWFKERREFFLQCDAGGGWEEVSSAESVSEISERFHEKVALMDQYSGPAPAEVRFRTVRVTTSTLHTATWKNPHPQ